MNHSSGSPGRKTSSFSPTALTVGTGRGTVRGTRVGADGVVRPVLGNTPGSENWTWVLDAVKPIGSALEPGVRKVLAVVAVAAGIEKPVLVVCSRHCVARKIRDYQKLAGKKLR